MPTANVVNVQVSKLVSWSNSTHVTKRLDSTVEARFESRCMLKWLYIGDMSCVFHHAKYVIETTRCQLFLQWLIIHLMVTLSCYQEDLYLYGDICLVKPSIYLHTIEELSSNHNGYLQSIMTVLTIYSTVIVVNVILNRQISTTMITSDIIVVFFFILM